MQSKAIIQSRYRYLMFNIFNILYFFMVIISSNNQQEFE